MTITVDDLKEHLNLTSDADDFLLATKITAATTSIERFIGQGFDAFTDGVPEPLLEATRQLASHLYINREPVIVGTGAQELPYGVFDLVGPYRNWVF